MGIGSAPTADGFFGGFEKLLAARADEVAALREKVPPAEPTEKSRQQMAEEMLNTHPPIGVRIAAMESLPDRAQARPHDHRRACALIPDFAKAAAETAEVAYVFGYRERLPWDDLVGRVTTRTQERAANLVYEAAARLAKEPTATLATVAALCEVGRAAELIRSAFPHVDDEEFEATVEVALSTLVRAAVVHAGVARWRVSWSGPAELVTADGEVFGDESFGALLADPDTAADAVARLAERGVDVGATGAVEVDETANMGEVMGGIADMKSAAATYDVLILDTGLVLAERPSETSDSGLSRLDRLQSSGSTAEIIARHRFVPYASMQRAKVSDWITVKATITLADDTLLRLKEQTSSEYLAPKNDEVFKHYLNRV